MPGSIAPIGRHTFFSSNGDPLALGTVLTTLAGTSTNTPTYTDKALLVPNANPIVLDAAGRATIYLNPAKSYKWTVKNAAGTLQWTQDEIDAVNSGTAGLGETFAFGGQSSSPVTGAYPVGAGFNTLHPGTAVYAEDSANIAAGTYKLAGIGVVTSGTLTVILVNLSDGAPETPIASLTFTSTTGERQISAAITFVAAGASKNYGIKAKVSAGGEGFAWALSLQRIA